MLQIPPDRLLPTKIDTQRASNQDWFQFILHSRVRSEVELQTKLDVTRVAGASEASEVTGADGQGRVAKTA